MPTKHLKKPKYFAPLKPKDDLRKTVNGKPYFWEGFPIKFERKYTNKKHEVLIKWQHLQARLLMHGEEKHPISFNYIGEKINIKKFFTDSFNPFKKSLENFINIVKGYDNTVPINEIKEIVTIISLGK